MRQGRGTVWLVSRVAPLVMLVCAAAPTWAGEALGDLGLRLRLIETTQVATTEGTATVATVGATLETRLALENVQFELVRSDGRPWARPLVQVDPRSIGWRKQKPQGGGDPFEAGDALAAGGAIVAQFGVSLPSEGLYTVVIRVSGETAQGPVQTETMVLVPAGIDVPSGVEIDGAVEFQAVASSEVQP